jgi:hypothetical protein
MRMTRTRHFKGAPALSGKTDGASAQHGRRSGNVFNPPGTTALAVRPDR